MKIRLLILICGMFVGQPVYAGAAVEPSPVKDGVAATGSKQSVSVNLTQSKVVKDDKGLEKLVEASSVKPGDILEYKATYTNVSSKAVKGLFAQLPIPEGLEYQANSSKPVNGAMVAASDLRFAREPLTRKLSDGRVEPIPYNEYRQVRWELGSLAPGGVAVVYARAKVEGGGGKALTPSSTAVVPAGVK